MSTEEKLYYNALKAHYGNTVLFLRTSTGHWAAQHADMDNVLSVYPDATMGRDFVLIVDARLDEIILALKAKGLQVVTAEQIAKAPKRAIVESFPLLQISLFECSDDDGLTWQPMPLTYEFRRNNQT